MTAAQGMAGAEESKGETMRIFNTGFSRVRNTKCISLCVCFCLKHLKMLQQKESVPPGRSQHRPRPRGHLFPQPAVKGEPRRDSPEKAPLSDPSPASAALLPRPVLSDTHTIRVHRVFHFFCVVDFCPHVSMTES